jgi:hypothetical protein
VKALRHPHFWLVAVLALALCSPLARVDWFWGQEKISYILRTVEWTSELSAGHVYPRWCPDFYGGYGTPLFMFHGPVIYGTAGFLAATVTDVVHGLKLVALLGCLASGLGTYLLVFGETRRRDAALLGAAVFLAAPYWSGNLYVRGDIGEFSCLALLPCVLALYRASSFEPMPVRARRLAVGASFLHAVLILTHPVLGLWGTLVIGAVVALTALGLARRVRRRAVELVLALSCAPLLAGLYVVPALIDRKATQSAGMVIGYYDPRQHWLGLMDLFDASGFMGIGPNLCVAIALVLLGLAIHFRQGVGALGWLLLCLVLIGLNRPEMSWFWAPDRLPLVEYIQFPWRLLGPASLAAAVAAGIGMAAATHRAPPWLRTSLALAGSAALLLWIAWPHLTVADMATAEVPRDAESVRRSLSSATDADEYLPLGALGPPRQQAAALVSGVDGADVAFSRSDGSRHSLAVRTQRDGAALTLALHSFPGWQVETLAGPAEASLSTDPSGFIRLRLPAVGNYKLLVRFGASTAARAGYVISVLGLGLLALLLAWPERASWQRTPRAPTSSKPVAA